MMKQIILQLNRAELLSLIAKAHGSQIPMNAEITVLAPDPYQPMAGNVEVRLDQIVIKWWVVESQEKK